MRVRPRRGRVFAAASLALSLVAVAQPASATNNNYSNVTLTKNAVVATGTYYDSRISACVRYSIKGNLTVPVNRGGVELRDVYARGTLTSPLISVSFTSTCSNWTYVNRKDVTATTSVYANNCSVSLSAGLSVPWSFSVGVGGSCTSGNKTATAKQFVSGPAAQFGFNNDGDNINFGPEALTFTTKPNLTYCARVGLKLQYSHNNVAYNMPVRSLNVCSTWTNPYY